MGQKNERCSRALRDRVCVEWAQWPRVDMTLGRRIIIFEGRFQSVALTAILLLYHIKRIYAGMNYPPTPWCCI
jgi:hypothetical protein